MTATATLNSLLRGELAATETYQQVKDKLGDTESAPELETVLHEHHEAASLLRDHVRRHGGEPEQSSGAWGTFAGAATGTAKVFGADAALKALKEGEEMGVKNYEEALQEGELPADCQNLIRSTLLPRTKSHVPVLDRLMAGLVARISPQEAKRKLETDNTAMLVCAYDSDEKFQQYHLEGAVSLSEFESQVDAMPKDRELIFYCA
jgi:uncharacterized protein (TIGR02284 family)